MKKCFESIDLDGISYNISLPILHVHIIIILFLSSKIVSNIPLLLDEYYLFSKHTSVFLKFVS